MTSLPGTSALTRRSVPSWAGWWPAAPRIVAESLATVPDPIRTGLARRPAGRERGGGARARARAWRRAEKPETPPRLAAAGPGADASAERWPRSSATAARCSPIPWGAARPTSRSRSRPRWAERGRPRAWSPPRSQTSGAARRPAWRAGRGRHPPAGEPWTAADHRPRDRHDRREPSLPEPEDPALPARRALAAGRPLLLLSATPIVNRLDDLAHQLLLGVRDDALVADGVLSIRSAVASGVRLDAMGRIVLEDTAEIGPRPERSTSFVVATNEERGSAARALASLARLDSPSTLRRPPSSAACSPGLGIEPGGARRGATSLPAAPAARARRAPSRSSVDARRARACSREPERTSSCCGSCLPTATATVTSRWTTWTAWPTSSPK